MKSLGRKKLRFKKLLKVVGIDNTFSQNSPGLGNIPETPKVGSFKEVEVEVDTGLNARRANRGDQCPVFNMSAEHQKLVQEMK